MPAQLITHNEEGQKLDVPYIKDLRLNIPMYLESTGQEVKLISIGVSFFMVKHKKESHKIARNRYWGLFPFLIPWERLTIEQCREILPDQPAEGDQPAQVLSTLTEGDVSYSIPFTIGNLRALRDKNYCTADFRFPSEVQHAIKIKEQPSETEE